MWREDEDGPPVQSAGGRHPSVSFEPDWRADRAGRFREWRGVPAPIAPPEPIDVMLVNPPAGSLIIVDTWTSLPPSPDPLPAPAAEPLPAPFPGPLPAPLPVVITRRRGRPLDLGRLGAVAAGALAFLCGGLLVAFNDRAIARSQEALAEQIARVETRLQSGLDALPRPLPPPDLLPLQSEVKSLKGDLDSLRLDARALPSLAGRMDSIRGDLDAKLTLVLADLEAIQKGARHETLRPAYGVAPTLKRGSELFEAGRCSEAREVFRIATDIDPGDARAWYYSALAEAKASGRWPGDAEPLFQKGIEAERAGSPSASEIDAMFAPLSQPNGRAWLAYYRGLVRQAPPR